MEKIIENNIKMKEMAEKCKDEYFNLFGSLILKGYDIQTAIDLCYNKLIKKENNGKHN